MVGRPWSGRPVWWALVPLLLLAHGSASAFVAPPVPTFVASWGDSGVAPGQFNGPQGMAADPDGYVYVADEFNNRIQKFDPLGNLVTMWGTAGAGSGQFYGPLAVATDASGNVYVLDANHRVQKFTGTGTYILGFNVVYASVFDLAVDPTTGNIWLVLPNGLVKYDPLGTFAGLTGLSTTTAMGIDPDGRIWVVQGSNVMRLNAGFGPDRSWNTGHGINRIAFDPAGNMYLVDAGGATILKYTRTGTLLGQWGTSGSGNGQFTQPFGITIDPAGNAYVSDALAHRVQKFSGAGIAPPFPAPLAWGQWGSSGTGNAQFNQPGGIACRGQLIYVVDQNNNRVQWFAALNGGQLVFGDKWGAIGSGNGQFQHPWGITTDPSGNVFVSDLNNSRVQKFSSNGTYLAQWGVATPVGIASDASGNIYVTDVNNNRVQKFTNAGALITSWGTPGGGPGQFNLPVGIAVDAAGNVYVVDQTNGRIEKFSSSGNFIQQWGSFGSADGQFQLPQGIAVDPDGNVAVIDAGNQRIQLFTSNGTFLTKWGSFGSGIGQLSSPGSLTTDGSGNYYVTDIGNNRVVEYVTAARIVMVSDVGNDQGGHVRVTVARSSSDAPGPNSGQFAGYRFYYRTDTLSTWTYANDVPATGDSRYSAVIPTFANATATSNVYTNFKVAMVPVSLISSLVDGGTAWGCSIDDLSPPPPTAFVANLVGTSVALSWAASPANDGVAFRLYRGATADFTPAENRRIAEITTTRYVDATPSAYYKLSAVDRNGNESDAVTAASGLTLPPPAVFALHGPLRNPTTAERFGVSFSLANAGAARLEVFDVSGRHVLDRDVGGLGIGWHDVKVDARVPAGVYQVRLRQGADVRSVRVIVLD